MASSSSLDNSINDNCSLNSSNNDDTNSEESNCLKKLSSLDLTASSSKDNENLDVSVIELLIKELKELFEIEMEMFEINRDIYKNRISDGENHTYDLNFELFRILIISSIKNFFTKQEKVFEKVKTMDLFNLHNFFLFIKNVESTLIILAKVTQFDFPDFFPLFGYLLELYEQNQFSIAENIWKIVITAPRPHFNEDKKCIINIIVFQNVAESLFLFDEKFNKKTKIEDNEQIMVSEKGFCSIFSGHLIHGENWISCKNNLFRTVEIDFKIWKDHVSHIKILFDKITYTLLMLYDMKKDEGKIGGFNDINITINGRNHVFDYNKLMYIQEQYKKKYSELKEEDIQKFFENKICLLNYRTNITINTSDIGKFFSQIKVICNSILKIDNAEKIAYEEFLKQHPEIAKVKDNIDI